MKQTNNNVPAHPPRAARPLHTLALVLAAIGGWWAFAAPHATSAAAADQTIAFNRDIRPLLSDKCFSCHGPDAAQRKADLRLDLEADAKAVAIVPGSPADSELWARVSSDDDELRMPPPDSGKSLTAAEIDLLKRWIAAGAPYERHWSFIPPSRPALPESPPAVRQLQPIDRFVLARLERERLSFSPAADRHTLLRRISLDLTGLPPTPAEIQDFLADTSDNAWEKVVDRLLRSDRYGEQMARHWLDAARYADTNGYQYDLEREQWVWRDWVIHAFNTNMPFDRFTIEQLAGDLLPEASDQQKLATAFHRNHPITIEGGVIDEEYRTEYVVDRVVTTSTVWLGLTMLCGRCHDHKYDPIQQEEFYRFFAFFNQVPERGLQGFDPKLKVASPLRDAASQRIERELQLAEQELNEQLAGQADQLASWERQLAELAGTPWQTVVPRSMKSEGGATLTVQPDQSVLASGASPDLERYDLELDADRPIHAIRLEALTDASLAGGGTGRASNGNFVLSEFQLAVSNSDAPEQFAPRRIASATADYSQQGYPIADAIDGRIDRAGWAVDGNTKRENRSAVFTLAEPLEPSQAGRLRIQLHHRWGGNHSIGRFRLAVATRPVSDLPADVAALVRIPAEQRTAPQQRQLREVLAERYGNDALRATVARIRQLTAERDQRDQVPATMVMAELPAPRATHVLFRGEYDKPRQAVTPGTPAALPPMPDGAPGNRLGLARWIVMPNHPLTARVAVNRFWQRLFGQGIVKTTEDFGSQGEWPSHPELLDWLAVDFVESGWDVKSLLKQIVMSETYRQSSVVSDELARRDPENRLLGRGPRLRLDAEVIRDSALQASGLLSPQVGGPSVFPYHPEGLWQEINNRPGYSREYQQDTGDKLYRRSLYTFWKRTVPPPSLAAFDAPEREYCVVRRSRTNTPLQSLVLLHDPQFVEAARHLGQWMLTHGGPTAQQRIAAGFQRCLCRPPNEEELQVLHEILQERLAQYRNQPEEARRVLQVGESPHDESLDTAELAAWTTVARVMMNLSEFVTKP
ncbi:MAG: PSD1 domain-containing protein [Pirellulaceae bacterium]|nr:PSD1 domain-containing protein [Pirellulaceae bacterium]